MEWNNKNSCFTWWCENFKWFKPFKHKKNKNTSKIVKFKAVGGKNHVRFIYNDYH